MQENIAQTNFKATMFVPTAPYEPQKSTKPLTVIDDFTLNSDLRASERHVFEVQKCERTQAAEEARRKQEEEQRVCFVHATRTFCACNMYVLCTQHVAYALCMQHVYFVHATRTLCACNTYVLCMQHTFCETCAFCTCSTYVLRMHAYVLCMQHVVRVASKHLLNLALITDTRRERNQRAEEKIGAQSAAHHARQATQGQALTTTSHNGPHSQTLHKNTCSWARPMMNVDFEFVCTHTLPV